MKGVIFGGDVLMQIQLVSIRTPVKGVIWGDKDTPNLIYVSIRTPVKGVIFRRPTCKKRYSFQSAPP